MPGKPLIYPKPDLARAASTTREGSVWPWAGRPVQRASRRHRIALGAKPEDLAYPCPFGGAVFLSGSCNRLRNTTM